LWFVVGVFDCDMNDNCLNDTTGDTFFNGALRVEQDRSGYRFSIDAVILADRVQPRPGDRVLELGAGCGIVLLILAFRYPEAGYTGVEVQSGLYRLALKNVQMNRMKDRIRLFHMDMRHLSPEQTGGAVDTVVCNPPYRRVEAGRLNPNRQKAIARHEMKLNLPDLLQAARRMLRTAGKFYIVYTVERLIELLAEMKAVAIEPKHLTMVYAGLHTEAKLALVEGVKGARSGCKVAPPLIIYDSEGNYTPEVAKMFER
jgi:tRNA1Val (adenine37-N6)-methyltransferase